MDTRIKSNKSYKIQVLRGVAIIAVIFIHNTPAEMWQVICRPFLNFSVGMFLFLSGMLSYVKKWNPKKRIMKVIIPYFCWSIIYVVLYHINTPQMILRAFLIDFIKGDAAAIMYYVFVYCEFTLLIPFVDRLARSKYKYWGFAITPIEIIVMRFLPMIVGYQIPSLIKSIMHISCLGWFTYFYLGYVLGNNILQLKPKKSILICGLVGTTILQILEGLWYLSMGNSNCGTQLKISAILTGILVVLIAYRFIESNKNVKVDWLQVIGNYSFGIYFSHLSIMWLLSRLDIYEKYIHYPLNAIITLVISFMCVFIGRRILGKWACFLAL